MAIQFFLHFPRLVSKLFSTQSNKIDLEARYGDLNNQWKVRLNQLYLVWSNLNRPFQLARHISVPGKTEHQTSLDHV